MAIDFLLLVILALFAFGVGFVIGRTSRDD